MKCETGEAPILKKPSAVLLDCESQKDEGLFYQITAHLKSKQSVYLCSNPVKANKFCNDNTAADSLEENCYKNI